MAYKLPYDIPKDIPIYPMRTVAQLTGVSKGRIRAWEEQYHLFEPARTEGGHRLYSEEDVERIRYIKRMIDEKGVSPAMLEPTIDTTTPVYRIHTVAERTGVKPRRIISWEYYGLLEPKRTKGGHRIYSEEDVQLIELIRSLRGNELSLSGIKRLLESDKAREDLRASLE